MSVCSRRSRSARGPNRLKGFASCFTFACTVCTAELTWYSSIKRSGKTAYDVNEKSTLAIRMAGCGYAGQSKFSELMDMPPPPDRKCVKAHTETILEAAKEEVLASMKRAAAEFRGQAETADLAVSYDGSWSQRGFTTSYGFGSVISNKTGKILDYHVVSKVCSECAALEKKGMYHECDQRKARKEKHKKCTLNHAASSKSMESDIAEVLWTR